MLVNNWWRAVLQGYDGHLKVLCLKLFFDSDEIAFKKHHYCTEYVKLTDNPNDDVNNDKWVRIQHFVEDVI